MEIRPLRRSTLYQEIVEQLQERILSGELAPGERLPTERELAKASASPVRRCARRWPRLMRAG